MAVGSSELCKLFVAHWLESFATTQICDSTNTLIFHLGKLCTKDWIHITGCIEATFQSCTMEDCEKNPGMQILVLGMPRTGTTCKSFACNKPFARSRLSFAQQYDVPSKNLATIGIITGTRCASNTEMVRILMGRTLPLS